MTSRPASFVLLAAMALGGGGCRWFRRTTPPQPPPAPAPPAPAPSAPQPSAPTPVVRPPKPKPEPVPAPAQPPPPPPAFGQILTPQQQTEFRRSYQQSAQFARQTLSQLYGRALSRDQADTANRIRSFLSQAEESLARDPSAAAQLARRAELLARDLLNSSQ